MDFLWFVVHVFLQVAMLTVTATLGGLIAVTLVFMKQEQEEDEGWKASNRPSMIALIILRDFLVKVLPEKK